MVTNLKEQTYECLRKKLLNGDLRAGDRISIQDLSQEIGVSRTPIREAINQLQNEGAFESIPRFGTFVRKLDRDEMNELFDIRQALETLAAGMAAERITEPTLDRMAEICRGNRELCVETRHAGGHGNMDILSRAVMLDIEFHMLIVTAAGNRYVAKAITDNEVLVNIMSLGQESYRITLRTMAVTYREHMAMLRTLRNGDADAARREAAKHVADSKRDLIDRYESEDDEDTISQSAQLRMMLTRMDKYFKA